MPSDIELKVLRYNTQEFIAADSREVVLLRSTRVSNGTGGTRPSPAVPQPAQTMRVLPQAASTAVERTAVDGQVVTPSWVLLGTFSADMKRGDRFALADGSTGEVVYVHEKRQYQVKGEVAVR